MTPSISKLAHLAAIMAKAEETPKITARRALELWQACEQVYFRENQRYDKERAETDEEYADWRDGEEFLGTLRKGASGVDCGKERVSLESFLMACMPNSKPPTQLKIWRDFRRSSVTNYDGMAGRRENSEAELHRAIADILEKDRN